MPRFHPIVLLSTVAVLGCAQNPMGEPDWNTTDTAAPLVTTTTPTTTPTTGTTGTTGTTTPTAWDGTWTGTIDILMNDFNGGQDACQADLTLVVDSTASQQISGSTSCEFTTELRGVVDVEFEGDLLFLGGTYRLTYDLLDDVEAWDGIFVDDNTFRGAFDGDNVGYADAYIFLWSGDLELTRE